MGKEKRRTLPLLGFAAVLVLAVAVTTAYAASASQSFTIPLGGKGACVVVGPDTHCTPAKPDAVLTVTAEAANASGFSFGPGPISVGTQQCSLISQQGAVAVGAGGGIKVTLADGDPATPDTLVDQTFPAPAGVDPIVVCIGA